MPIVDRLVRLANNAQTDVKAVTRQINNSSLSSATVEIVLDTPKSQYTSGDVLSGEVIIRLTKEIDVSEVTLKYKVDEHTELIAPETQARESSDPRQAARDQKRDARRNRDGRNDRVFKSEKRIFESAVKLFPSAEIAQHLSGKLTLPQGTHKYPFSIRIPTNRSLPPTFTDSENKASIYHHLKATLRRSSQFKQNARYELPLEFSPSVDSSLLNNRQAESRDITLATKSLFNRKAVEARINASAPNYVVLGKRFSMDVKVLAPSGTNVTIHSGSVTLTATCEIKAQQRKESKVQSEMLCDLGRLGLQGSQFDLSPRLQNLAMSQTAIPSFTSAYITVAYALTINLYIGRGNDRPEQFSVSVPVVPVGHLFDNSLTDNVSPAPVLPSRPNHDEKSSYQPPASPPAPQSASQSASQSSSYPPEKDASANKQGQELSSNNPFSPQWTGSSASSAPAPESTAHTDVPPPDYYD